jgi:hypothetical protein
MLGRFHARPEIVARRWRQLCKIGQRAPFDRLEARMLHNTHGRAQRVPIPWTDERITSIDPPESDEGEDYHLLMPLNALCSLIERMKLDAHAIPMLQPACGELMAHMFGDCRSALVRRGLLEATHDVNSHAYGKALSLLRAIAA